MENENCYQTNPIDSKSITKGCYEKSENLSAELN